jgi:hypothetical protein
MDKWIRGLSASLPDRWTGCSDVMERRYRSAHMSGSPEALIEASKTRTMLMYLLIAFLLICVTVAIAADVVRGGLSMPARDEYGGDTRTIDAEVKASYEGKRVKRDVSLKVLPRGVESGQISEQMQRLRTRLPAMISGENASLNNIVYDLDLPSADAETGIDIAWESDKESLIDERGEINPIAGAVGEEVMLTAYLRKGEVRDDVTIRVVLGRPDKQHDYGRNLEDSLRDVVKNINQSTDGTELSLPEKTDSGIRLKWRAPSNRTLPALIVMLLVLGFAVYRNRYAPVDNAVKRWREGVRRDFPGFLNKLLLLLNAGLVVTSAIMKIADDYESHRRAEDERCFYEELIGIKQRMQATNTTLVAEFTDMATRSGQREVMRFGTILADNIDRGNVLAEKLSQENQMLRRVAKKHAEEKVRLAETKLTFPMVLQLLVIVLITVTPAVLNMR